MCGFLSPSVPVLEYCLGVRVDRVLVCGCRTIVVWTQEYPYLCCAVMCTTQVTIFLGPDDDCATPAHEDTVHPHTQTQTPAHQEPSHSDCNVHNTGDDIPGSRRRLCGPL
jgi:hypothetical protein